MCPDRSMLLTRDIAKRMSFVMKIAFSCSATSYYTLRLCSRSVDHMSTSDAATFSLDLVKQLTAK